MNTQLSATNDLFELSAGDIVSKRNLYDLIQYSKVRDSRYWSGEHNIIGNTPQQGINWVGIFPDIDAVIIKSKSGIYGFEGWTNDAKASFTYSFKARAGGINLKEKANRVLIKQPQYEYPILLFTAAPSGWEFEGRFSVTSIEDEYVVLEIQDPAKQSIPSQDELLFQEGEHKYVSHLMAERSKGVIEAIKTSQDWICEICGLDFNTLYGFNYIEAHHKKPISSFSDKHTVSIADLALLCPNCHKAVHLFMKSNGMQYNEIVKKMKGMCLSNKNFQALPNVGILSTRNSS